MWLARHHLAQADFGNEATGYVLGIRGSIPYGGRYCFFTTTNTKPLYTTQSLARSVTSHAALPPTRDLSSFSLFVVYWCLDKFRSWEGGAHNARAGNAPCMLRLSCFRLLAYCPSCSGKQRHMSALPTEWWIVAHSHCSCGRCGKEVFINIF